MSEKPEKDQKQSRDPAASGFCACKMEEMMQRCAEQMPGLMAAWGRARNEEKKADAPAGCCAGGEEKPAPAAGGE